MGFDFSSRCDCCSRSTKQLQEVNTALFKGKFCPVCVTMIQMTTRPDGTSRLHPTHLKQLLEKVKFNQASNKPIG